LQHSWRRLGASSGRWSPPSRWSWSIPGTHGAWRKPPGSWLRRMGSTLRPWPNLPRRSGSRRARCLMCRPTPCGLSWPGAGNSWPYARQSPTAWAAYHRGSRRLSRRLSPGSTSVWWPSTRTWTPPSVPVPSGASARRCIAVCQAWGRCVPGRWCLTCPHGPGPRQTAYPGSASAQTTTPYQGQGGCQPIRSRMGGVLSAP
jgi:hypothetical protein